jgi:hypothetical protein
MMSVHAESDVPRVAVEELLWNVHNLCVASISLLYHLENVVVLKVVFSESILEFQGSNIFTRHPLSASANGLPMGGFHLSIVNHQQVSVGEGASLLLGFLTSHE